MDGIGRKIRHHRLMKDYNQEYMAFALEISQAAYSNIERDETEITVQRIFEIAEIFQISPYELMPKPKFGSGLNYLSILIWAKKLTRKLFGTTPYYKVSSPML